MLTVKSSEYQKAMKSSGEGWPVMVEGRQSELISNKEDIIFSREKHARNA